MALLTNNGSGAGYLAVELTIDKRSQPALPFARGPVISWELPDDVYEALRQAQEEMLPIGRNRPRIGRHPAGIGRR